VHHVVQDQIQRLVGAECLADLEQIGQLFGFAAQ
jgi:hypothetical protein